MANAPAALFDGTDDELQRGADLTGLSDGKQFTLSVWFRDDLGAGSGQNFIINTTRGGLGGAGLAITLTNAGEFQVVARNAADSVICFFKTSTSTPRDGSWHNALVSVDMSDTGKRHLYIDDTSDISVTTYIDDTIDFTEGDFFVSGSTGGTFFNGGLCFAYFKQTYLDLSITGNRRKFIDAADRAVNPPADGVLCLRNDHSDFETNDGSGGNFSVNGGGLASTTGPELSPSGSLFFGTNF